MGQVVRYCSDWIIVCKPAFCLGVSMNGTWCASTRYLSGKAHFFEDGSEVSLCGKMKRASHCRQTIPPPDWKPTSKHTCPACFASIVWREREAENAAE